MWWSTSSCKTFKCMKLMTFLKEWLSGTAKAHLWHHCCEIQQRFPCQLSRKSILASYCNNQLVSQMLPNQPLIGYTNAGIISYTVFLLFPTLIYIYIVRESNVYKVFTHFSLTGVICAGVRLERFHYVLFWMWPNTDVNKHQVRVTGHVG